MDRAISEQAIKLILTEIHLRLGEATRLARAATTCAEAGAPAKAQYRWTSSN
ncbi:hypothetical protein BN961_00330 [Afipia felis]|uniref:Uncharacterized protein n=1 Tax=Afipia felis TaxID=1035 RepID=A0A090MMR6_AFIFE|nr:hypothetical protein BN961_00330 [Afipia felis]